MPIVAIPNAIQTVTTGADMFGNKSDNLDKVLSTITIFAPFLKGVATATNASKTTIKSINYVEKVNTGVSVAKKLSILDLP